MKPRVSYETDESIPGLKPLADGLCNIILMFHKPKGVVVSRSDERGRRTVYDCLPQWVFQDDWLPVGRLDRDSRGLLLFTQDGRIVERLTRPHSFLKTYELWIRGRVTEAHIEQLIAGVQSRGELLRAQKIMLSGGIGAKSRVIVELDEGRNRHIRRMFAALIDPLHGTALKVLDLKRLAFGTITLDIPSGKWRFLSAKEVKLLLNNEEFR